MIRPITHIITIKIKRALSSDHNSPSFDFGGLLLFIDVVCLFCASLLVVDGFERVAEVDQFCEILAEDEIGVCEDVETPNWLQRFFNMERFLLYMLFL